MNEELLANDKPWRDRNWRMIKRQHTEAMPLFLEMNADGTATQWKATMYGPLGQTGKLSNNISKRLEKVSTETDKRWLEIFIVQLEQSDKLASGVAGAMLTTDNGKKK